MTTSDRDWAEWHSDYDEPGSRLAIRLALVQARLETALDAAPVGNIQIVSLCAGQGRDVIGAVARHRRREDVRARLVELDERNVAFARQLAADAALPAVDVVHGDASVSDAYIGVVPAQVVLACGIFGNITEADIRRTIDLLPMLCAAGATVIWTRHRREPDLTPQVRAWFGGRGFEDLGFDAPTVVPYVGVGSNRWPGEDGVLEEGVGFFEFGVDSNSI